MSERKVKQRKVECSVRRIGEKEGEKSDKKHIEVHRNTDKGEKKWYEKQQEEGWWLLSSKKILGLSLKWLFKKGFEKNKNIAETWNNINDKFQ